MVSSVYMGFLYQMDEDKKPIRLQSMTSVNSSKVSMSGNYVLFELVKPALGKPYARELMTGKKIPILADDINGSLSGEHTFLKFDGSFHSRAPIATKEDLLNYCYYHKSPELYENFLNSVFREGEMRAYEYKKIDKNFNLNLSYDTAITTRHFNEIIYDLEKVCDIDINRLLSIFKSNNINKIYDMCIKNKSINDEIESFASNVIRSESLKSKDERNDNLIHSLNDDKFKLFLKVSKSITNKSCEELTSTIMESVVDFSHRILEFNTDSLVKKLKEKYKLNKDLFYETFLNNTKKENGRFDADKLFKYCVELGMLKDKIKNNYYEDNLKVNYNHDVDSKIFIKSDRVVEKKRIDKVGTYAERTNIAEDIKSGSFKAYLNQISKPTQEFETIILNEEFSSSSPIRLVKGQFDSDGSKMYTPPFITEGYGVIGTRSVATSIGSSTSNLENLDVKSDNDLISGSSLKNNQSDSVKDLNRLRQEVATLKKSFDNPNYKGTKYDFKFSIYTKEAYDYPTKGLIIIRPCVYKYVKDEEGNFNALTNDEGQPIEFPAHYESLDYYIDKYYQWEKSVYGMQVTSGLNESFSKVKNNGIQPNNSIDLEGSVNNVGFINPMINQSNTPLQPAVQAQQPAEPVRQTAPVPAQPVQPVQVQASMPVHKPVENKQVLDLGNFDDNNLSEAFKQLNDAKKAGNVASINLNGVVISNEKLSNTSEYLDYYFAKTINRPPKTDVVKELLEEESKKIQQGRTNA